MIIRPLRTHNFVISAEMFDHRLLLCISGQSYRYEWPKADLRLARSSAASLILQAACFIRLLGQPYFSLWPVLFCCVACLSLPSEVLVLFPSMLRLATEINKTGH